jgi:hypothetical protein
MFISEMMPKCGEQEDERKKMFQPSIIWRKIDGNIILIFMQKTQTKTMKKHFMKYENGKKQIKMKLKYCTIILEDKELKFYSIFNLFKHPTTKH